jgi:hypothetical protein
MMHHRQLPKIFYFIVTFLLQKPPFGLVYLPNWMKEL